ncbi:MAG: EAL domain-containing protein [Chroococcidiopsidaceae cyanobacterium CP_BM_ER_R8_30]|nr:EAL domain-containing protein [Chroococcidiopsidaceae cyanobacterium CP_BM_ER_R8_30]
MVELLEIEIERLKTLSQYQILDTAPEAYFDDLTRLAAYICHTPIAAIGLIGAERQWFKSRVGILATEESRNITFCAHTILQADLLIVPDTLQDERFVNNPFVTGDTHIRFYAGAPLITPDGFALGTLCVLDHVPRELSNEQQEALRILALQVLTQLELRRNLAILEQNILERQRTEAQLRYNIYHDELTGLPNRALLMERLMYALNRSKQQHRFVFAVLFIDLDRFKLINDSLGHLVGDQLLIVIAQRLRACLRNEDTAARLGGDEFAILLENLTDVRDATNVARRLQAELALPFHLCEQEVFISCSVGIALSTLDYDRPEDLIRDADTAMYRAKTLGKACYQVFNPSMHEQMVTLLQLETHLQQAIGRHEFRLHYQPIVSLFTGSIIGFEALVRWQHPLRGLILPQEFIPVAEETGVIIPIGYSILHEACRQLRSWQIQYSKQSLSISINLSSRQFSHPQLIQSIRKILQETHLDACCLKIEITESTIMENVESVTAVLLQLRDLGIELHMDDFGTGYSSLSYLHRFPVDVLKIDRSFIASMSSEKAEIVRTIVMLAHNLGIEVTAEGIETEAQVAQLQAMQCQYGQGYFFSKPVDAEVAGAMIAQGKPRYKL